MLRVFLGVCSYRLLSETALVSVLCECLLTFLRTHTCRGLVWFSSSHPTLCCAPAPWALSTLLCFPFAMPEGEHLSVNKTG